MTFKSLLQIVIIFIIFLILGSVYFKYFSKNNSIVDESSKSLLEKNQSNPKKNNEETKKIKIADQEKNTEKNTEENNTENKKLNTNQELAEKEIKKIEKNEKPVKKEKIKNLVTDIEYLTADDKGNKYKILATSGKTNSFDSNVLDLKNVRGTITSPIRATVYIISDFGEYNSYNQNSKFYQNVVVNYEDKELISDNLDLDIESSLAIAYNNVIITDPKSVMKAGKVTLDLKTKDINILPESNNSKVKINTKN